jgi:hypothetical protein
MIDGGLINSKTFDAKGKLMETMCWNYAWTALYFEWNDIILANGCPLGFNPGIFDAENGVWKKKQ